MSNVAVLQLTSNHDVKVNLEQVDRLLNDIQDKGVKLAVLPENFAFMGLQDSDKLNISEEYQHGPIQAYISDLAKKYRLWIIAGTIHIKDDERHVRASSIVYDDKGKIAARYDKIHLFDVHISSQEFYHESDTINPGKDIVVVDTPVGKIGLSVCYDLRFPELYHLMQQKGAEIFSIPAAFTYTTGKAHWDVLIRARAIENSCYVLAPNQSGTHASGRQTYGHSAIISPWGEVLAQEPSLSKAIIADINIDELYSLRQNFPTINHHQLDIRDHYDNKNC
jgi:predicted amidohydrolase